MAESQAFNFELNPAEDFKTRFQKKLPEIPIVNATTQQAKEMEALVKQVIEASKNADEAKVEQLEAKINKLVNEIYGLTDEEVQALNKFVGNIKAKLLVKVESKILGWWADCCPSYQLSSTQKTHDEGSHRFFFIWSRFCNHDCEGNKCVGTHFLNSTPRCDFTR